MPVLECKMCGSLLQKLTPEQRQVVTRNPYDVLYCDECQQRLHPPQTRTVQPEAGPSGAQYCRQEPKKEVQHGQLHARGYSPPTAWRGR